MCISKSSRRETGTGPILETEKPKKSFLSSKLAKTGAAISAIAAGAIGGSVGVTVGLGIPSTMMIASIPVPPIALGVLGAIIGISLVVLVYKFVQKIFDSMATKREAVQQAKLAEEEAIRRAELAKLKAQADAAREATRLAKLAEEEATRKAELEVARLNELKKQREAAELKAKSETKPEPETPPNVKIPDGPSGPPPKVYKPEPVKINSRVNLASLLDAKTNLRQTVAVKKNGFGLTVKELNETHLNQTAERKPLTPEQQAALDAKSKATLLRRQGGKIDMQNRREKAEADAKAKAALEAAVAAATAPTPETAAV